MTKEEKIRQRDAEIDQIIDRFDMTAKCGLTREQIHQRVIKGMVSTNLAHVMADAANSLLLDAEDVLKPMQVCFSREEKYHYRQMLDHITAAKKWAAKSAFEPYQTKEADLFAQDVHEVIDCLRHLHRECRVTALSHLFLLLLVCLHLVYRKVIV